ncbi:Uncharacterised protein [Corynebacterium ulcerans]|nr:Uncharacterised protein [Corynebacterium ulcerans]
MLQAIVLTTVTPRGVKNEGEHATKGLLSTLRNVRRPEPVAGTPYKLSLA